MPGLDDIQLPPEDANKTYDTGETPEDKKTTPPTETPAPVTPPAESKPDDGAGKETPPVSPGSVTPPETKETKPEDKPTPPSETKSEDTKPTPFHEHPDWKKMQEEKHQVELENARLKGQNEVLEKRDKPVEVEDKRSAAQVATAKVEEKLKGGWKPKDQLELQQVYGEEFEAELERREQAKVEKAQKDAEAIEERRKEVLAQVDKTFTDNGITKDEEQNKAIDLVNQWVSKKIVPRVSIEALGLAIDHLKAKGEIGRSVTTTPTPTPPGGDTTTPPTPPPEDTNKKIIRPSGSGTGKGGQQPKSQYAQMHNKDLDAIVADATTALG